MKTSKPEPYEHLSNALKQTITHQILEWCMALTAKESYIVQMKGKMIVRGISSCKFLMLLRMS